MPKVKLYDMNGKEKGEVELSDAVFGAEVNEALMHDVVVMYQANQRQGTSATKTRGLVSGGGKKPWRQKGTGRARAGSTRSPLWRKGGTTFGPAPREYRYTMPRQARRAALRSALSAKVKAGEIVLVDRLALDEAKTKEMVRVLGNLQAADGALVVTAAADETLSRSSRNIPGVHAVGAAGLNVYSVLTHDKLVMTKDAAAKVEEALTNG
ncbi:MAG: 50S ribosomal protein L4 [Bacillota bacterium]